MKYLVGFSLILILSLLSSFTFGSVIYENTCINRHDGLNFVNMVFDSCPSNLVKYSSCFGQNVFSLDDTLDINFNSTNGVFVCQVEVIGSNLSSLSASIVQNGVLNNFNVQSTQKQDCLDKKTFIGEIDFNPLVDVIDGKNIYSQSLRLNSDSSLINSVKVNCFNEIKDYSEVLKFENKKYYVGSSFVINSTITGDQNYSHNFEYTFLVLEGDSINFSNYPSGCIVKSIGGNKKLVCNRSVGELLFSITPLKSGTFSYTTSINYVGIFGITNKIFSNKKQFSFFNSKVTGSLINQNTLFFKLDSGYKAVGELRYGDVLNSADIRCVDSSSKSVNLIVKNINQGTVCNYYSNNKVSSDLFLIDLKSTTYNPGLGCLNPLVLDKSGLYSFEINCAGDYCSGDCYNPISNDINSGDWKKYLVMGKYLFSFYGNNSIPDCVCNVLGKLVPIKTINSTSSFNLQDLPASSSYINANAKIVGHGDNAIVSQGNYIDIELNVTCNGISDCGNIEVSLQ